MMTDINVRRVALGFMIVTILTTEFAYSGEPPKDILSKVTYNSPELSEEKAHEMALERSEAVSQTRRLPRIDADLTENYVRGDTDSGFLSSVQLKVPIFNKEQSGLFLRASQLERESYAALRRGSLAARLHRFRLAYYETHSILALLPDLAVKKKLLTELVKRQKELLKERLKDSDDLDRFYNDLMLVDEEIEYAKARLGTARAIMGYLSNNIDPKALFVETPDEPPLLDIVRNVERRKTDMIVSHPEIVKLRLELNKQRIKGRIVSMENMPEISGISSYIHDPPIYVICGQWISYGHSNFMNTKGFIMVNPPTAELSHDVWDAAALDEAGHCAVIATDCIVYEEAPANFLVAHKRDKRWTQGSLSALKIIVNNKVSIVERFFILIGGLQFLNNAIFLPWLILQFCNMVFWNYSSIQFPMDFFMGRYAMNGTLFFVTAFSIGTFLFHPFLVAKNLKDVRSYVWYLFFANLTIMTNLVNGCLNCLSVLICPIRTWAPMEKNPFAKSPVFNLLNKTIPTSVISLTLFILAWQSRHVFWIIFTSPVLLGGIGSPIILWWSGTARCVEEKEIDLSALDVKTAPPIRRDAVTVEV